jgi:hypothetical protein
MELVFLVIEMFVSVLSAVLSGELSIDEDAETRDVRVPAAPVELRLFADCSSCGKPNLVDSARCEACGALCSAAQTQKRKVR